MVAVLYNMLQLYRSFRFWGVVPILIHSDDEVLCSCPLACQQQGYFFGCALLVDSLWHYMVSYPSPIMEDMEVEDGYLHDESPFYDSARKKNCTLLVWSQALFGGPLIHTAGWTPKRDNRWDVNQEVKVPLLRERALHLEIGPCAKLQVCTMQCSYDK